MSVANTPEMRVATRLYGLRSVSSGRLKGKGWRLGNGVVWKGLVKGKWSPLEKGVLGTKKEERKNELKTDWKKGTRDGQRLVSCGSNRGKTSMLAPKLRNGGGALSPHCRRRGRRTDESCAFNETDW